MAHICGMNCVQACTQNAKARAEGRLTSPVYADEVEYRYRPGCGGMAVPTHMDRYEASRWAADQAVLRARANGRG